MESLLPPSVSPLRNSLSIDRISDLQTVQNQILAIGEAYIEDLRASDALDQRRQQRLKDSMGLLTLQHQALTLLAVERQQLRDTFPVAASRDWERLFGAIHTYAEHWHAQDPAITMASAIQCVENAVKKEFHIFDPQYPGQPHRGRIRNFPCERVEEAVKFLSTLPPPYPRRCRRPASTSSSVSTANRKEEGALKVRSAPGCDSELIWGPHQGSNLRMLRKSRGLTLKALGDRVYRVPSVLSGYENGLHKPDTTTWALIAQALEVSPEAMYRIVQS